MSSHKHIWTLRILWDIKFTNLRVAFFLAHTCGCSCVILIFYCPDRASVIILWKTVWIIVRWYEMRCAILRDGRITSQGSDCHLNGIYGTVCNFACLGPCCSGIFVHHQVRRPMKLNRRLLSPMIYLSLILTSPGNPFLRCVCVSVCVCDIQTNPSLETKGNLVFVHIT